MMECPKARCDFFIIFFPFHFHQPWPCHLLRQRREIVQLMRIDWLIQSKALPDRADTAGRLHSSDLGITTVMSHWWICYQWSIKLSVCVCVYMWDRDPQSLLLMTLASHLRWKAYKCGQSALNDVCGTRWEMCMCFHLLEKLRVKVTYVTFAALLADV